MSASPSSSSSATGVVFSSTGDGHSSLFDDNQLYYHYQPSPAFAVVAFIVFGLLSVLLLYQIYRFAHKKLAFILAAGAILEFVGYLLRYLLTSSFDKNAFIVSYVLILVTPNFFAFVNYSAVGRLLTLLPTKPRSKTWLRIPIITDSTGIFIPGRISTFFFISDIFAFLIQCSAAAFLTSSNPSSVSTGQTIVEIGLAWGLAFIALFFFVTIFVYVSSTYEIKSHPDYAQIKRLYISLFITITLLLIRSIYRMVEYVTGQSSYVYQHEWVFGVFDTLLMALACLMYSIFPYGKYLNLIHLPGAQKQLEVADVEMGQSGHVVQVTPADKQGVVVMHGVED